MESLKVIHVTERGCNCTIVLGMMFQLSQFPSRRRRWDVVVVYPGIAEGKRKRKSSLFSYRRRVIIIRAVCLLSDPRKHENFERCSLSKQEPPSRGIFDCFNSAPRSLLLGLRLMTVQYHNNISPAQENKHETREEVCCFIMSSTTSPDCVTTEWSSNWVSSNMFIITSNPTIYHSAPSCT